jgi:uncharacterized protein YuzE
METLKIYYDQQGKTLTIWFDDPSKEYLVDEVEEDVNLMKDQDGNVIGIERLNYHLEQLNFPNIEFLNA